MIIETIQLVNDNLTISELQSKIDEGYYNDILVKYSFLIMTEKGLVKVDKEDNQIKINPVVDLNSYQTIMNSEVIAEDKAITPKNNTHYIIQSGQVSFIERTSPNIGFFYKVSFRTVAPVLPTIEYSGIDCENGIFNPAPNIAYHVIITYTSEGWKGIVE